jgi:hypothetical protein
MTGLRIGLLVVLLGSLIVVVVQNQTPVLPLVLLGQPTAPLPLAVWVLGALCLGSLTSLAQSFLISPVSPQTEPDRWRSPRSTARDAPRFTEPPSRSRWWPLRSPLSPPTQFQGTADDWLNDTPSSTSADEWSGGQPQQPSAADAGGGYRSRLGAPGREPVVDADFRVIMPPSRNLDEED